MPECALDGQFHHDILQFVTLATMGHDAFDRFTGTNPLGQTRVLYAGSEACAARHRWDGVRDHALFHIVANGQGRVWGRHHAHQVGPGEYFLYLPHTRARYQADAKDPWTYLWVGFTCEQTGALARLAGVTNNRPVGPTATTTETGELVAQLIATIHARTPAASVRANGLLLMVLSQLNPEEPKPAPRFGAEAYVAEAVEFIHSNYQRPISVAAVAEHIGVDRAYLSRCFRSHRGVSLQQYLIAHRMQRAAYLLRSTRLPVMAVAASVGYQSYAGFERRYRAVTGESPRLTRTRPLPRL